MENSASGTSDAVGATWIHHFHLSNNSPTKSPSGGFILDSCTSPRDSVPFCTNASVCHISSEPRIQLEFHPEWPEDGDARAEIRFLTPYQISKLDQRGMWIC